MFKDLLRRRVPQILGVYLAVGWGALEFTDWLVNRYLLSPYLIDFILLAWGVMTPTVLMLAWFHGAPGRDRWVAVEKIGIPVNVALAALLLFVTFGDKELGATTTSVTVENEAGETEERVVPKSEFRKHVALFYLDNESGDTALDWLQYGIAWALQSDLLQDVFVESRTDFTSRFERAGMDSGLKVPLALKREIADEVHLENFLTGTIAGDAEQLTVTTALYETERGKLLEERTFSGSDIFALIDSISLQLKRDLKIPAQHIEEARDLPAKEILTSSLPAFRSYVNGLLSMEVQNEWEAAARYLEDAVELDPSFAWAHTLLFLDRLFLSDTQGATESLMAAIELNYKLPERVQFGLRANYYRLVRQDPEKAMNLAGMWSELFPDDINAHQLIAILHTENGERERAIAAYERILEIDPGQYDYFRAIGSLYQQMGEFERAADFYRRYADQFPDDARSFTALGGLSSDQGGHETALEYYERALLLDPENTWVILSLVRTAFNLGRFDEALGQLKEALAVSQTAERRVGVYDAFRIYYTQRGQLRLAVDYMHRAWAETTPPVTLMQKKLMELGVYAQAGMSQVALDTLEAISRTLSPPLDLLPPLGAIEIAIELEDTTMIREAVAGLERLIAGLGVGAARPLVIYAEGKVLELDGQCDQAIINYRRSLKLLPTEVTLNTAIGRCYRELGNLDQALESIERTLRINPYDAKAHYEKALVHLDRSERLQAREHLQTALAVWRDADPDFELAQKARARLSDLE